MKFYSTKNRTKLVAFEQAVLQGLADDGGLFMPESLPRLSRNFFKHIKNMSFQEIAFSVANEILKDDIPQSVLQTMVEKSFNFEVPLVKLADEIYVLELFHGPTLAFKDFAARFMSQVMSFLIRGADKKLTILVATSGDTGSAVANGFYEIPGIEVIILYPNGKISTLQEKQIATLDKNITVLEIDGSFDDCQRLVKQAFLNAEIKEKLWLTSANSINIARLIPQSFYYFYAFARVMDDQPGLVFSVPCGNFGNLTGGLMAKKMGLPVLKFIAVTNANDIIPQYLKTGTYLPQPAKKTISNAMDVGDPSNWDRIMDFFGHSINRIKDVIISESYSDEITKQTIRDVFARCRYMLDPHSAIGCRGLTDYLKTADIPCCGIALATAHPAKFRDIVEEVIKQKIEMPSSLKSCLAKKKKSILLTNEMESFKEFLLS